MTAPADTPPAPLDEVLEPGEGGYPDEAQPCQLGGSHPATHSILFRDEDAYAPSCDDHAAEIRETLIEAGETIVGQVPIVAAIDDEPVTAAGPAAEVLDGQASELAVRFPVIAVEGLDTADGRLITADALTARPTPLTVLCQTRAAHGGQPPPAAWTVGRIDTLERVPGPDVVSAMTGEPFPEGTWVWRGTGTIDPAALVEGRPIGELLARRFVRGISADLVPSDFEVFGDGDASTLNPDEPTRRAIVHKADLAGLTIIPVPAFGDCTVELADAPAENMPADMPAVDPTELGLAASAFPAWRSAEVGDYPATLVEAFDRVRTARGVKWYRLPIGALIRRKKPGASKPAKKKAPSRRERLRAPSEGGSKTMTSAERARTQAAAAKLNPVKMATPDAVDDYLVKNAAKDLNPAQRAAIEDYSTEGYLEVNGGLRAGRASAGSRRLDSAMRPLPDDITVVRSMKPRALGLTEQNAENSLPGLRGRTVSDKAFFSTSAEGPDTRRFEAYGNEIIMRMVAPKGTPAIITAGAGNENNAGEREIILGRNTKVMITGAERRSNGGWLVDGIIVPKGSGESGVTT